MSIMNMPPLAYRRILAVNVELLKPACTASDVWQHFDLDKITLCSPDPQAIRPPGEKPNVLTVTLPTNFKVARFGDGRANEIIRKLEAEIDAARFETPEGKIELPVKLRFYDSIFVPLAKWAMLMAGNYRYITEDGMRTAKEAVHSDLAASRSIYDFVLDVCTRLGASRDELVTVRQKRRRSPRTVPASLGGPRAQQWRLEYREGRQIGSAYSETIRHESSNP
jgi:hypothetical protein